MTKRKNSLHQVLQSIKRYQWKLQKEKSQSLPSPNFHQAKNSLTVRTTRNLMTRSSAIIPSLSVIAVFLNKYCILKYNYDMIVTYYTTFTCCQKIKGNRIISNEMFELAVGNNDSKAACDADKHWSMLMEFWWALMKSNERWWDLTGDSRAFGMMSCTGNRYNILFFKVSHI